MANNIFEPEVSAISEGLEGKVILIFGHNNLGKTYQATRFPKPFVIACEMGLNGIDGAPYLPVTRWSDFKNIVSQFTGRTKEAAKEKYSTIIIDEVYASSLYAQDYVCSTYGDGALTLADGDSKHNLYQLYEKEYFKQINLLTSAGFTVVFIAHEQINTKTGYAYPKGDKRCIDPIVDKCDYVIYLKSNGVDENNNLIRSSAYLAETDEFFARSRIEHTPTYIKEFTAENLQEAIRIGIEKKRQLEGATIISFEEQSRRNSVAALDFDALKDEFDKIVEVMFARVEDNPQQQTILASKITRIVEKHLGKDKKVAQCSENQVEAIKMIVDELKSEMD